MFLKFDNFIIDEFLGEKCDIGIKVVSTQSDIKISVLVWTTGKIHTSWSLQL